MPKTSVASANGRLTVNAVHTLLETMLDPFNVKILAMELVLAGQMSEDDAVETYDHWCRNRIDAMISAFRQGNDDVPN